MPVITQIKSSAGTGKTRFLIDDVLKYLGWGYEPEDIALVSFTKAAASEAIERICRATGYAQSRFKYFSTIHSMCFRELGMRRQDMMMSADYTKCGKDLGISLKGIAPDSEILPEEMTPTELQDKAIVLFDQLYRDNPHFTDYRDIKPRTMSFMRDFEKWKRKHNKYDFVDLLQYFIDGKYTLPCRVAYVDEAQDITTLQWKVILQAFFTTTERIKIAYDKKQMIYEGFGANMEPISELKSYYTTLDKSWRVPSRIMKVGNKIGKLIDPLYSNCKTSREGGELKMINLIEQVDLSKKNTLLLCYSRSARNKYKELCIKRGVNFIINGIPYISALDILSANTGVGISRLTDEKLSFIKYNNITEYTTPNIEISTIHGVKGKEADYVYVMTDIPAKIDKEEYLPSIHRVFYVACTRAKQELVIIAPQTEHYYGHLLYITKQIVENREYEDEISF